MNLLAVLILGAYLGYRVGQNAAYEEVGELLEVADGPSFADIQRELAAQGMQ